MADGLLDMIVQTVDFETLDTAPGDVLQGEKFVGKNATIEPGEMVRHGSPDIVVPLNGSVKLPVGNYEGGFAKQSIPVMNTMHITPGTKEQIVPTKDMYMADNIYIDSLSNLRPEYIKKGQYVGGVGPGQWEGFVVTDPNIFYYRGTLGPGQSIKTHGVTSTSVPQKLEYRLKNLAITSDGQVRSCLVFNAPKNVTGKTKLKIDYSIYMDKPPYDGAGTYHSCFAIPYLTNLDPNNFANYNDGTGTPYTGVWTFVKDKNLFTTPDDSRKIGNYKDLNAVRKIAEFDISAISRDAYLTIFTMLSSRSFIFFINEASFL